MHRTVDLGRIGHGAALGGAAGAFVDDHLDAAADLLLQLPCADRLLRLHEPVPALVLDLLRHRIGQPIGGGAVDRLEAEAADAVELGFLQPGEQFLEIGIRLAGKADDEGRADGELRADLTPLVDTVERLRLRRRPPHRLEHARRRMLERDVQVGEDLAFGHQRDDLVDMRVGIDVVEAHPDAELAEFARQVEELRPHLALAPDAGRVLDVEAVGAGVLRDDQQLLHAGLDQLLGLAEHLADRPRDEVAAQIRDDAEAAAVIATF